MLDPVANFISLVVQGGYDAAATSITLVSGGSLLPSAGGFNVVWWNSTDYLSPNLDPNVEIVRVTNISGNGLTIVRGQETAYGAPAASAKNTSGKTYSIILGITAKMIADIAANLQKPWRLVNVDGVIDGTNTVFTLDGSIAPFDPNSMSINLARQPQEQGIDYEISGVTITYITPPDKSLSGQPHTARYQ